MFDGVEIMSKPNLITNGDCNLIINAAVYDAPTGKQFSGYCSYVNERYGILQPFGSIVANQTQLKIASLWCGYHRLYDPRVQLDLSEYSPVNNIKLTRVDTGQTITLTTATNPSIVAKSYRTSPDQAENAIQFMYGVDGDIKFKLEIIA